MTAAQAVTVREAARRVGRSEETIRRWIWSGRLPAVKQGTSYRIDVVALEEVIVELEPGMSARAAAPYASMLDWLAAVDQWKRGVPATAGPSASEMLIEDRHARR